MIFGDVLLDVFLLVVFFIACVMAFILGFLVALSARSSDEHRAYLRGYKDAKREREAKNGNSNNLRQMQRRDKGKK